MITSIPRRFLESSLWKSAKGFMGDDLNLELAFHRTGGGRSASQPDAEFPAGLEGAVSHRSAGWVPLELLLRGGLHEQRRSQARWRRTFNCTLLLGDVTGDGLTDLLTDPTNTVLQIRAGVPGPELFTERSVAVLTPLPNDEEYAWLTDLDRDGVQDLVFVLHSRERGYVKLHAPFEPSQVTLLFAR